MGVGGSRPWDPFNLLWVAIPLNLPHKMLQMLLETCPISSEVEILTFWCVFQAFNGQAMPGTEQVPGLLEPALRDSVNSLRCCGLVVSHMFGY